MLLDKLKCISLVICYDSHDVDLKTFWLINHSLLLSQGLLTMISFSHDFKCINAHIIIKKNQIFDWGLLHFNYK
jgi:hypothetical protein